MINPCGVVAAFLKLWQVPEYVDPTEQLDPDFEPMAGEETFMSALASHMPEGVWHRYSVELLKAPNGEVFCDEAFLLPIDSSHAAPPACDEGPTGVCDIPQSPPVGLPKFRAIDLEVIAAEYINEHRMVAYECACGGWADTGPGLARVLHNHAEHVAELVVSALTDELTSLAYDQSHQAEK